MLLGPVAVVVAVVIITILAVLVVIIGTPSATTTVDSLRAGWIFSAACFAVTAVIAVFIGAVRAHEATAGDDDSIRPPVIAVPDADSLEAPSSSALAQAPLLSRLPEDVRTRLEA